MFDNDDPADRTELIRQLNAEALPATEYNSGGGIMHVIVPLLHWNGTEFVVNAEDPDLVSSIRQFLEQNPYDPNLVIATNSLETPCEIGLMGENVRGEFVTTRDWTHAPEIQDAVRLFTAFWSQRDEWLTKWLGGQMSNA